MREHTDGDFPFANDFNALVRDALEGSTQVESGCAVSDGGTDDTSVEVASGAVVIDGTGYSISNQTVSLASADPDQPRYDLVVADSSEAMSVTGTPASAPKAPSIPSGAVLLAIVEIPAGASGVTGSNINDARVILDGIDNTAIAALENLSDGEAFDSYPLSNGDVSALAAFGSADSFSQYPLRHGTDVDAGPAAHHTRPTQTDYPSYDSNGYTEISETSGSSSVTHFIKNKNSYNETLVSVSDEISHSDGMRIDYTLTEDATSTELDFDIVIEPGGTVVYSQGDGSTGSFSKEFTFTNRDLSAIKFVTDANSSDYGGQLEATTIEFNEQIHYHTIP